MRLAHSADLGSRLRHVFSAPSVAYSTGCSQVVNHPGTKPRSTVLYLGDLTGTGMLPPLGGRLVFKQCLRKNLENQPQELFYVVLL